MREICDFRPLNSPVAKRTDAEYLTTAVVGAGKVVFLSVRDATDVTVLRDRFTALLLFGPQGGVARGISSGVLLRFRAGPSGVFWQGARADGRQMARRDSGRVDGLALPGRVAHTVIHSPRLDHPPMVVKDGVGGAWVLSESTEDYVLGTEVTSFLSRSSVIGLHGLFLLNGVCVRAVEYVQDRLGLLRRLLRPEILNACDGIGDDSSGFALDGDAAPRGTPVVDMSDAQIPGTETDVHGEDIRAFSEAIKAKPVVKAKAIKTKPFWGVKKKGEEDAMVQWLRGQKARDNRTRGRGRGNV